MAKGGGGGKRGGGGKPTARSQNYLRQYGYPSSRELRREAQGLAGASVPTIRSVQRPYQRQMQSTRDFLAAVQSALADTSAGVGAGYDQAIGQSQAVDQAAQARLAGLGLGDAGAGVQAAVGARGDSATQNLISNAAAAKNYAAQLPAVAAGSASRQQAGLQKSMLDALANRRDQLSQAFFQALQQVQGMHLQEAGMVQSGQQFQQNLALQQAQMAQQASQFGASQAESIREFNLQQAASKKQQAWSNKMDIAKFEASAGYNPITGKTVPGASASLSQFSPAELRAQAKIAAPFLHPMTTQNVTRSTGTTGNRKSVSSKKVTYGPTAPAQGMPFTQFLGQLTDAGVNPTIAVQMAAGLYERYQDPLHVLVELNSMRPAMGLPPIANVSGISAGILRNAQAAYASFVHYAQHVGLLPRHNPAAGNYGEGGR